LADSAQRNAYVGAQVEAIHRNLRFLEAVVTAPIGLTTDLKSLREAMPVAGAAEERDRQAFHDLTGPGADPKATGLMASVLVKATLELLADLAPGELSPLAVDWQTRAAKVIDRVGERLGADARKRISQSIAGVYVIVDPEHTNGRAVEEVTESALRGGAATIQLRDKKRDKAAMLDSAISIREMCGKTGAVLIVNDHADIARLADADGLHVGQADLPIHQARRILRPAQIVGKSNALAQEALESEADGADYVAVGAMFETQTKSNTRPAGVETLGKVKRSVGVPVIAIGGINATNARQVIDAGADAICVASAVTLAQDPESATRALAALFGDSR
jgi:thiamine-phosphate diphosphorylase